MECDAGQSGFTPSCVTVLSKHKNDEKRVQSFVNHVYPEHSYYSMEFLAQSLIDENFYQSNFQHTHGGEEHQYMADLLRGVNIYLREGAIWFPIENYIGWAIRPMKLMIINWFLRL